MLSSGGGRDRLYGVQGSDTLIGGGNDDTLVGGPGPDVLIGNRGDDLFIAQNMIVDTLDGGRGNDRGLLDADDDGASIETLLNALT